MAMSQNALDQIWDLTDIENPRSEDHEFDPSQFAAAVDEAADEVEEIHQLLPVDSELAQAQENVQELNRRTQFRFIDSCAE